MSANIHTALPKNCHKVECCVQLYRIQWIKETREAALDHLTRRKSPHTKTNLGIAIYPSILWNGEYDKKTILSIRFWDLDLMTHIVNQQNVLAFLCAYLVMWNSMFSWRSKYAWKLLKSRKVYGFVQVQYLIMKKVDRQIIRTLFPVKHLFVSYYRVYNKRGFNWLGGISLAKA